MPDESAVAISDQDGYLKKFLIEMQLEEDPISSRELSKQLGDERNLRNLAEAKWELRASYLMASNRAYAEMAKKVLVAYKAMVECADQLYKVGQCAYSSEQIHERSYSSRLEAEQVSAFESMISCGLCLNPDQSAIAAKAEKIGYLTALTYLRSNLKFPDVAEKDKEA